jgi:hypothetical protein
MDDPTTWSPLLDVPLSEMSNTDIAAELVQIDEKWKVLKARSELLFAELQRRHQSPSPENDVAD